MSKLTILLLTVLVAPLSLLASSSVQFNSSSLKATGFDNAAGNAAGGLSYGIIIDTNNNGFSDLGLNYDGFAMPAAGAGVFLARGVNAAPTDDFFFWNGQTTVPELTGTDGGFNGLSTTFGNIPNGSNGVNEGDAFAIVWFDTTSADGAKYGFFTNPLFVVPANSATVNVAAAFNGDATVKLADNTLGLVAAPIPEPSRMMLLGFGLAGLFFRRRR